MPDSENFKEEYHEHPYGKLLIRSYAFVMIYSFITTAWKAYVVKMYKRDVGGPLYSFNLDNFSPNNSDPFISLPYIYHYQPIASFIEKIY